MSTDDFTLYVFVEDLGKLKSFPPGAEGKLYGLWTSTLNPVLHVMSEQSSSSASSESIRSGLAERYKMSYLGDWRAVRRSDAESMIRPPHDFQPGGGTGFLAVNVVNDDVQLYMFERPSDRNPKRGSVDKLPGDNPFTNDPDIQAIIRGTNRIGQWQGRPVPTGSEGYENYRSRQQRGTYGQRRVVAEPIQTKSVQWYAGDGGEQSLKRVFDEMKRIADGEVKMSRDTQTQDITLSFKCRATRRDWKITFPARFPREGAMIIEENSRRFASPVEKQMSSKSNIDTAIEEIRRTVQSY